MNRGKGPKGKRAKMEQIRDSFGSLTEHMDLKYGKLRMINAVWNDLNREYKYHYKFRFIMMK